MCTLHWHAGAAQCIEMLNSNVVIQVFLSGQKYLTSKRECINFSIKWKTKPITRRFASASYVSDSLAADHHSFNQISFKSEIFAQIAATLVTERFKTTQRLQGWKRTGTMLWCTTRNKNVKLGANVDLYLLTLCIYVLIFLYLCLYSQLFVFVFKYFVHISSSVLLLCSHLFWVLLFQK